MLVSQSEDLQSFSLSSSLGHIPNRHAHHILRKSLLLLWATVHNAISSNEFDFHSRLMFLSLLENQKLYLGFIPCNWPCITVRDSGGFCNYNSLSWRWRVHIVEGCRWQSDIWVRKARIKGICGNCNALTSTHWLFYDQKHLFGVLFTCIRSKNSIWWEKETEGIAKGGQS